MKPTARPPSANRRDRFLALVAIGLLVGPVAGSAWAGSRTTRIEVFPPDVQLDNGRDRQGFIVVATRPDGVTDDVTQKVKATLADASLAKLEGQTLYPKADGQTTLAVEYDGHSVSIPVTVKSSGERPAVGFRRHVMPVFMRSGCNVGGCHGAARGKDGFRLSLFGFDPEGDYHRLTREIGFRRLNLAVPEASLLMEKAVGSVPHTGGKRFDADSEHYATLLEWLRDGAPNDSGEPRRRPRSGIRPCDKRRRGWPDR
ncbi:MAG: hypothetical protein ACYTG0_21135 [Planctomycetota bacterium]